MNTKPNTTHAGLTTQVERQVEKKSYTHDTDSYTQANRQGMFVRETKAIIGKAPRLGVHTLKFKRDIQDVIPSVNVITFSERNIWGTQLNKFFFNAVWMVWL